MSDEEFLARWSRRKREAEAAVDAPPRTAPAEPPSPAPQATAETPADAEVDLSTLPSIESITGGTDITAFLRKGISPELRRAALRRAWAVDPAIRNFVGLAENAWDFNDPNAMPGFGPLDCSEEQLAALVDRIVGSARGAVDCLATAIPEQEDARQSTDSDDQPVLEHRAPEAVADLTPPQAPAQAPAQEISTGHAPSIPAAVQSESPQTTAGEQTSVRRRTHGSALPR
jgi:hypothetical protein